MGRGGNLTLTRVDSGRGGRSTFRLTSSHISWQVSLATCDVTQPVTSRLAFLAAGGVTLPVTRPKMNNQ